ncbi:MAG: polysaccharide biosynthesis/export family protein [Prevotella sp.]|nr:polysaccharide biosynthesis/export family protein [Prevotella sp.]MCM1074325.1 polysaccharide biosynthesis/export family protein [Ruminococcus sp.]
MRKYIYLLPLLALLCSCKTHENLAYFSVNTPALEQVVADTNWQLKIVPDDELAITVTSEVAEATAVYNLPSVNPKTGKATGSPIEDRTITSATQIQTYIVDKQGDINFPKLGKIHVAGLTTAQLAEELTRRIAVEVEAPYVRVELCNFKVNVLGEVTKPGIVHIPSQRFTILDALAEAGDLSIFGRRDNVTLVREENGKITYHRVDLNDAKLFESPYYYVQQNDAIYVEPTEARRGQAEYNQNNSYKISVVSAIVSGASVIASLIIALAVNK